MPSLIFTSFACVALQSFLYLPIVVAGATSFVPVRRQTYSSGLRGRELHKRTELLRPRSDVDLHYLPGDGSDTMLITVTATHSRDKYVMVEDIDPLIYNVYCSEEFATLSLDFRHDEGYAAAKQMWGGEESLLFVTQHATCNTDVERAVHKSTSLTFDDALLRLTASSQRVTLGDSPHASSKLIISGSEVDETALKRLSRRDAGPEKTKSTTFDLDAAFAAGKDHLVTVAGLELYCDDCSLTGQASPFFRYEINTQIMDCADKIEALKHQKDDTFLAILEGIGEDLEAGLECIGDGIQALADGLAKDVADLIDDKPDSELPVVSWIVPKAVIGIEASENIAAKLNFEASSPLGIDVKCSFPGAAGPQCGVTAISGLLAPKSSKSPNGLGFSLGSWELGLEFSYGLTVEAKATAEIDVKLPITARIDKGQSAELSLISPDFNNTFDPTVSIGEPTIAVTDPELCLAVALGPSIAATLSSTKLPRLSNLKASARLDLPRVQSCFKPAHNVDSDCNAGSIEDALEMDVSVDFGLHVELQSAFKTSENLTPALYKEFDPFKHCFGFDILHGQTIVNSTAGGDSSAKSQSQQLTPLHSHNDTWSGWNNTGTSGSNATVSPSPTGSGSPQPINTGAVQGNYTSPYDCSAVGPSPGEQPCAYQGGGTLKCLSLYSWSCPNGDSGPVPADTVCACGAFRHPGWQPPNVAKPSCTSGIYCFDEKTFGVCGPAGIEPPQPVAPGTVCIGGAITYPY